MRDAQVAVERDLVAGAGDSAEQRCDRRLVERADRGVHGMHLGKPALDIVDAVTGAFLEILARGEGAITSPGNDHRADRSVGVQRR